MQKLGLVIIILGFNLATSMVFARDIDHILKRWQEPSSNDIFVVAHRAAFMEDRKLRLPENSIPAIEYAIELGVDMVELDIRATKDGKFIIMHDSTIDRTTNGSGAVVDLTLDQLRTYRLINEITGEVTEHKVPTLEEVYTTIKNKIMVNLDPKLNVSALGQSLQIAKDMGVQKQVMLKGTADTAEQLDEIKKTIDKLPFNAEFMPMHWSKNYKDINQLTRSFSTLKPEAAEMVVNTINAQDCTGGTKQTDDGGVLFSDEVRKIARENSIHLWINTLYVDPIGFDSTSLGSVMWNGGRHDVLGLTYPDQVFKFWVDYGATIIQTDEPKFLIEYLERNGLRAKTSLEKKEIIH